MTLNPDEFSLALREMQEGANIVDERMVCFWGPPTGDHVDGPLAVGSDNDSVITLLVCIQQRLRCCAKLSCVVRSY